MLYIYSVSILRLSFEVSVMFTAYSSAVDGFYSAYESALRIVSAKKQEQPE